METTSIRVWNNETFPTGLQGLTFDIIFISIRTWTSCANGHGTCNPIQDIHPSSLSNRWMWCWRNSSGSLGLTTPRRREFFSMKKVNLKFGWTSGWFRLPWMIGIHPALSFPSFFLWNSARLIVAARMRSGNGVWPRPIRQTYRSLPRQWCCGGGGLFFNHRNPCGSHR